MERETSIGLVRGFVQIVAVGTVLGLVLRSDLWVSVLVLLVMLLAGTSIGYRRVKDIPGAFWTTFRGIGFGAGLVILAATWMGVIEPEASSLIPVGSMIVANAMNSSALALERFRSDVRAHSGQIEAGLALGAAPYTVVRAHAQAAVSASLIPKINTMNSLGIVWIPGLMAGMVLAGTDPVYAAIYQFVVMSLIFAASGLSSIAVIVLIRAHIFSPAEQLVLTRAGGEK
jgi:putative ABC transport system permease protein